MVKLLMIPGGEAPSVAGVVPNPPCRSNTSGSVAGGQIGVPRGCNTIRLLGGGWMAF